MLNGDFVTLFRIFDYLNEAIRALTDSPISPTEEKQANKEALEQVIPAMEEPCARWDLRASLDRLARLRLIFQENPFSRSDAARALRVFSEVFRDELGRKNFYLYPEGGVQHLVTWREHWKLTLDSFPSLAEDIGRAVDLYALQHPTACVYHLVCIAEIGMRTLARELKVRVKHRQREIPLEWAQWGEVIAKLQEAKQEIVNKRPRGSRKDEALDFYSSAIIGVDSIKDLYRNSVGHARKKYAMDEAVVAMRQVRDFMNKLSTKLEEGSKGAIRWGKF